MSESTAYLHRYLTERPVSVHADAQASISWSLHVQNALFHDARTAIHRRFSCGRIGFGCGVVKYCHGIRSHAWIASLGRIDFSLPRVVVGLAKQGWRRGLALSREEKDLIFENMLASSKAMGWSCKKAKRRCVL
jgi:hypothetical protein